jgi:hypothetical protein
MSFLFVGVVSLLSSLLLCSIYSPFFFTIRQFCCWAGSKTQSRLVSEVAAAKMLSFSVQHAVTWLGLLLGAGAFYVSYEAHEARQ